MAGLRELLFPLRPRREGAVFDGFVSNPAAGRFPLEQLRAARTCSCTSARSRVAATAAWRKGRRSSSTSPKARRDPRRKTSGSSPDASAASALPDAAQPPGRGRYTGPRRPGGSARLSPGYRLPAGHRAWPSRRWGKHAEPPFCSPSGRDRLMAVATQIGSFCRAGGPVLVPGCPGGCAGTARQARPFAPHSAGPPIRRRRRRRPGGVPSAVWMTAAWLFLAGDVGRRLRHFGCRVSGADGVCR